MVLSVELDQHIQHTISHTLGLPVPQQFLLDKLSHAEHSKRDLEAQVYTFQRRILELQHRLSKSREEASMNAASLKRYVADNQKLGQQFKQISQQCAWLEDECCLYLNDREVFMGVADEAEERAFKAEERAVEAEKKVSELLEVERLKQINMDHAKWEEEIARLKSRITQLESEKTGLEIELKTVEATAKTNAEAAETQIGMQAAPSTTAFGKEDVTTASQESCIKERTELWMYGERQGTFEQQLMAEVQRLWQEVALYKCNVAKAEIQIQILAEDNKDLRLALRNKCPKSASPLSKEGKAASSRSKRLSDFLSDTNFRQPLVPLQSNLLDLR